MELFAHQRTGIEFLQQKKKAILADEMGLGKTRQAIVAAKDTGEVKLVVCPASLKINWQREIKAIYPNDTSFILTTKEPPRVAEWMIVNYDILEKFLKLIEALIENGKMKTVILDEAHYIKGKTKRSACIVGGSFAPKGGQRVKFDGIASGVPNVYCLTGTPLLNRPIELFNLLKAIGHPLGASREYFAKRYCNAFTMVQVMDIHTGKKFMVEQKRAYMYYGSKERYKHLFRFLDESGASNLEELQPKLKAVMLRRKKADVLDLPEKIISVMECDLSEEWQKAYDTAWDKYLAFREAQPVGEYDDSHWTPEELAIIKEEQRENIMSARHLIELTKLKQVCSQSKVDRIVEDVKNAIEQGEKVIVFSQYTSTIEKIAAAFTEKDAKAVTLTGTSTMEQRQKAVDDFQTKDSVKVFVSNIKAGGVGITLTKASIVMFADMEWSPETHAQAEDRAHRYGQTGTVNVYYYVQTGTIEEDIIQSLNEKKGIMEDVLDGKKRKKSESALQSFMRKLEERVAKNDA